VKLAELERHLRRQPDRAAALRTHGENHVIVDHGQIAGPARQIVPQGVDAALDTASSASLWA
jgi:hypothetical protein